jgi:protein-tyrosine phosphatase
VLFVCLGNICRSPLAEAAFRAELARRGVSLTVDSAGTSGWHEGQAPDKRAQAVARKHGADISQYRARQVRLPDFARFTHIVALDADNRESLHMMRPEGARAQISLLLDYVPGREGQAVADPWYGDIPGFEITWRDVSEGAAALARHLFDTP